MKMKKILTAALTAVLWAVMLMSVTASAANVFDEAKEVGSGKKVTATVGKAGISDVQYLIYKIKPTEKGTATIKLKSESDMTYFYVYNADGEELEYTVDATSGKKGSRTLNWNKETGFFKGNISFDVKANKTYYIKISRPTNSSGSGKCEISFSYPTGESTDDAFLTVTLKKGDTLQLGANVKGDVTYSTSKKSVATVTTKGTVTAVKAGTATITVKSGSKSVKVKVIVQ